MTELSEVDLSFGVDLRLGLGVPSADRCTWYWYKGRHLRRCLNRPVDTHKNMSACRVHVKDPLWERCKS